MDFQPLPTIGGVRFATKEHIAIHLRAICAKVVQEDPANREVITQAFEAYIQCF